MDKMINRYKFVAPIQVNMVVEILAQSLEEAMDQIKCYEPVQVAVQDEYDMGRYWEFEEPPKIPHYAEMFITENDDDICIGYDAWDEFYK